MLMKRLFVAALVSMSLLGETLGFIEQRFNSINFEKGKWTRTVKIPCYVYEAKEDGAAVEIMRFGTSNLVAFHGNKGLTVTICGSTAAFDEGFEAKPKQ